MAFVAYLVSLVAAFVGVLALYGVLLKPVIGKRSPPAQAVAAEKADPETTSSTRVRATPAPVPALKRDEATGARKRDEANEARAEEPSDVVPHEISRPAPVPPASSRRSPVRAEPGEGLRLEPERCWIVTDSTRGFGYYGDAADRLRDRDGAQRQRASTRVSLRKVSRRRLQTSDLQTSSALSI